VDETRDYLLAWHPPLHTPYISSPNHYLLVATHAHTITTCFGVVPRLCHLNLVSLSTVYSESYLVTSHHTSLLPFSSLPSGFMKAKGTTDTIFIVRHMQKFRAKGKKLYFGFVDLEKAFDRVPREVIRWAMCSIFGSMNK